MPRKQTLSLICMRPFHETHIARGGRWHFVYRPSRLRSAPAQRVVPGTGTQIDYVGDTFEDPEWTFVQKGPEELRRATTSNRAIRSGTPSTSGGSKAPNAAIRTN